VPATAFYDYEAKYVRDDTLYHFDFVDRGTDQRLRQLAVDTFRELGCRHLARVDLFLDEGDRPWVIEVNTLPGFTTHSLLPMAARRAGLAMPALVDRLVRLAAES
ncbi:MAG: D-alanine--D-alanine ligase, partial [Planctomycetota bacterium]